MGLEPVEQLVCESWQGVHIKYQYSSVGRASASYVAGHRFDPGYWYQSKIRRDNEYIPHNCVALEKRELILHLYRRGVNGSMTVSKTVGEDPNSSAYANKF